MTAALRFFCFYGHRFFTINGVQVERAYGGRKMKYHQDLEVVRNVAQYNMRLTTSRAYIFEVFPTNLDHVLVPVPPGARRWHQARRATRLVFVEMVAPTEERIVRLTERQMAGRASR